MIASALAHSGVTGTWQGTRPLGLTPGAGAALTLDLTAKDTALTGTVTLTRSKQPSQG